MAKKRKIIEADNNELLRDITRYGDKGIRLTDVLYYGSERTVAQYKKMRMHPMSWLGLSFIKLGLADVPFSIECDEDENIRLIVEKMLKKIWRRLIRDALEKLDYGFKCAEIRWEVGVLKYKNENEKEKTFNGHLFKQPRSLDGETVEILVDPGVGTLRGFRQDNDPEKDCLVEKRKALIFTHNLESGNFYGISAQEASYPYWYDANLNRQFHMRWLERKGTGFFKGYYPEGTTQTEEGEQDNQDIMLDLLDTIMEGNAIALPSERDVDTNELLWDIQFMSDEDKTDPFLNRANYIDEMILKSLIIPEKALTQGEVGARASIESFQSMFIQRKQDVLDDTVDTIDKYLLPSFIELNFGKDIEVHVLPGRLDDNSKEVARAIVEKLLDKDKIKVDTQWVVDKTGIPLEEQEPPEPEIKEEMFARIGEKQKVIKSKEGKEEEIKEEEEEEEEVKMSEGFSRWREMNKWEVQYNLADLESSLDRRSQEFKTSMTEELITQCERVKRYLDREYNAKGKSVSVAKGIEIKRSPIRKILKSYLDDVYKYAYSSMQVGVEQTIKFASGDAPNQYISFRVEVTSDKFAKDLETEMMYQVNDDLSSQRAKPEMKEKLDITIQKFISSRLENVAETELGFVLDKGIGDYIAANKKAVNKGMLNADLEVVRVRYSAIMDSKVCAYCAALDGIVTSVDSGIYTQYSTPAHYMCRCVWLPITKGEVDNIRITGTNITLNPQGRPLTINDIVTGKNYMVDGTAKSVGAKVDLRTFSDTTNDTVQIHFYKPEEKKEAPTTIPIELNVNMDVEGRPEQIKKTVKKTVSFTRDSKGNLSGAEIKED